MNQSNNNVYTKILKYTFLKVVLGSRIMTEKKKQMKKLYGLILFFLTKFRIQTQLMRETYERELSILQVTISYSYPEKTLQRKE